jgi:hypothetical protein
MFAELTNSKFHTAEFIPVEDVVNHTGYRSVFAWSREDADAARAAGTVKVLKDRPAFADTIFVDFDNNEKGALAFKDELETQDVLYEMYTSGGRSIHFHISTMPVYDALVPNSVRKFMQNFKQYGYDESVYNYCSLFRLTGTLHEKTGKPKELIETGGFYYIDLQLVEPDRIVIVPTDHDALSVAIAIYSNYIGGGVAEGGRYTVQWKVAKAFQEAGLSFDTALELVLAMDESWKNLSKGPEETKRAVKDAYRI